MPEYTVLAESDYYQTAQEWRHRPCGSTVLMQTSVVHPIHDAWIPLAGSGQVYTERVPYCPTCQTKPSSAGAPLSEDPRDRQEHEILERMRRH